jgi:hypothetical protein
MCFYTMVIVTFADEFYFVHFNSSSEGEGLSHHGQEERGSACFLLNSGPAYSRLMGDFEMVGPNY